MRLYFISDFDRVISIRVTCSKIALTSAVLLALSHHHRQMRLTVGGHRAMIFRLYVGVLHRGPTVNLATWM